MKQQYFNNPGNIRMAIVGALLMLLMVFHTGRAESGDRINEVRILVTGSNEISVQVRTDDGRPVKFELFNSSGSLVHNQSIFHSKVTLVKGISTGPYQYRCTSSDHDIYEGKIVIK